MPDKTSSGKEVSRRKILSLVGAGGVTLGGFSGVVDSKEAPSSQDGMQRIPERRLENMDSEKVRSYKKYINDEELVEKEFQSKIQELEKPLQEYGIGVPDSLDEAADVSVLPGENEGKPTARILAKFTKESPIELSIFPETDTIYAEIKEGGEKVFLNPGTDPQPMSCSTVYDCVEEYSCTGIYYMVDVREVCLFPDGSVKNKLVDTRCMDSSVCSDTPTN